MGREWFTATTAAITRIWFCDNSYSITITPSYITLKCDQLWGMIPSSHYSQFGKNAPFTWRAVLFTVIEHLAVRILVLCRCYSNECLLDVSFSRTRLFPFYPSLLLFSIFISILICHRIPGIVFENCLVTYSSLWIIKAFLYSFIVINLKCVVPFW